MSPKRRSAERPKLRMDDYSNSDKNVHQKGALDARREIDKVIKKARRDGSTHSAYWTKKLLEVEEKEPDRWHHSGYKELYVDNSHDSSDSPKTGGAPVAKKPRAMYSPSAPTSPLGAPARASRRSSTPSRRADRRSVSSDVRRGSSRSRTDRFSSSARQRSSVSPPSFRRAKSRSPVAAARRSRSPAARRARPLAARPLSRRSRTASPRPRKLSPAPPPRRGATAKSPMRAARSPAVVARTRSPGARLLKPDRTRNRSIDKVSPSIRRKKSPKVPRYKSPASRSPPSKSPTRRRSKVRSRSPLSSRAARRKLAHKAKYRGSSSSGSRASSSPRRKKNSKQTLSSDVLSSSDCSDSNCSICLLDRSSKDKRKTKADKEKVSSKRVSPPPEPRLKPRAALPRLPPPMSSSRYARSRSFSIPKASSPPSARQVEAKQKKKSAKKEKKKLAVKASKAASVIHHKKIKVESPSDESESPSPRRITLSERFGKMAKWNQKKDVESNQRNIRVTAGDHYRVEELDVPLLEPFPEPSPLLLDGSWDDVRVRYAYYKDQGYLEDLSFQDYLKWEEWWYSYQDWLETERLHSLRRRL